MLIQKLIINVDTEYIYTDYDVYLEETHKYKVNLGPCENNIIVYRQFDIYNENILIFYLSPDYKIRFSLGNKYKGEIEVCIKKSDCEAEYLPWINGEYRGI
jgi:hypothetical protein